MAICCVFGFYNRNDRGKNKKGVSFHRFKQSLKIIGIKNQYACAKYSSSDQGYCSTNVNNHSKGHQKQSLEYWIGISGLCLGLAYFELRRDRTVFAGELIGGKRLPSLPSYGLKEVSAHNSRDKGVWVIYKAGVYDVTDFIDLHPGGDKVMLAAGGSIEPFWQMYGVHNQEHIHTLLEKYRIGNLNDHEELEVGNENDPYRWDPVRHPALKPSSEKPFNAEPPPDLLVESFITPQEIFYVRNHLPVPDIDITTFELEITGLGIKTKTFTLNDLKKLPKHTVTASIQCAGNRRGEMSEVKPVKGLSWGHAVIGNATWTGVSLRDLLLSLGIKPDSKAKHIHFEGADCDVTGASYGASVPLEKVMDPNGDVILAYEMNNQPISRDHGFPLRAIVPGIVGARNVKWLSRIVVSEKESDSHWQQKDYKGFSPSTDWDNVDWEKSPAIQELPVTSAICSPLPGANVSLNPDNTLTVKGYAWSGGGRGIVRVDVTLDGGKSWETAELTHHEPLKHAQNWAWTLWTVRLPVQPKAKSVEIWAKAVDSSYNTQPESFSNIWNLRGVLSNAYHRVRVSIVPPS